MKAPTVVATETDGEETQRTKSTRKDLGSMLSTIGQHSSKELAIETPKDYGTYHLDSNSEIVTTCSKEVAKAMN